MFLSELFNLRVAETLLLRDGEMLQDLGSSFVEGILHFQKWWWIRSGGSGYLW